MQHGDFAGRTLLALSLLALSGCTAGAQTADTTGQPSTVPGHYDFTGLKSATVNGRVMTPDAALDQISRNVSGWVGQINPVTNPVGGSARIVLPDHDRLRVLASQRIRQPALPAAVELFAEQNRLDLLGFADAVRQSRVFSSVDVVQQNVTVAPDPAGVDYLLWFQVQSASPNNAGPWIGRWLLRKTGRPALASPAPDPGTAVGVPRLASFVSSVQLAASGRGGSLPSTVARSGTGIVLDAAGHVLTNNHVTAGCTTIKVADSAGQTGQATVAAADATNDLALLTTDRHWPAWARLRDHGLRPGEPVVVTGYPLGGLVSPEMAVTTGSLTAMAGMRGDTRQIEFSAPIQPGNSGGPVLDGSGQLIAIASAQLNALAVALAMGGSVPQNVNFGIKAETAHQFLEANGVTAEMGRDRPAIGPAAVGDLARKFTVKIECMP